MDHIGHVSQQIGDQYFKRLLARAREAAAGGYVVWRDFEISDRAAVALILNRPAWLELSGSTLTAAVDDAGYAALLLISEVAQELREEGVKPVD